MILGRIYLVRFMPKRGLNRGGVYEYHEGTQVTVGEEPTRLQEWRF